MANEYAVNRIDLFNVAEAIRLKGGTDLPLQWPNEYITAIQDISTGIAVAKVKVNVATSNGSSVTATILLIRTDNNAIVEEKEVASGATVTFDIPAGMPYEITPGHVPGYTAPKSVTGQAIAGEDKTYEMTYQYGYRYGFKRKKSESNPSSRITYLYDAEGKTPLSVNQSTGAISWGGWQTFVDELCRPVMLKYDGTVDYELNHSDQTKKLNGTSSGVSSTSYGGNAMVEFRKFKWVCRYEDATYDYVIFSDIQYDETYRAFAHTNESGVVQDAFYWGMFKGTYSNSRLRSIGTGSIMSEQTRSTEISRAKSNGSGWYTIYKSGWDFICDILTLLGKSDNTQAVFGAGNCDGDQSYDAVLNVGSTKAKPAFYGTSNAKADVKVLYIEGMWGNGWEAMAGMIKDSSGIKVKMTPPYNTTGSGYSSTGVNVSDVYGFVKTNLCSGNYGYIPKAGGGSSTTYMCDTAYIGGTDSVYYSRIAYWPSAGDATGARALGLSDDVNAVDVNATTRLAYVKP